MNPNQLKFRSYYSFWAVFIPYVHLFGLVLVWNSQSNMGIWSLMSASSYLVLVLIITYTLPKLSLGIGYANWMSLLRLVVLHGLFVFHLNIHVVILVVGFIAIMILDGVDGYLARRFREETIQGAALDNETDALMTIFLCWIHISAGRIPEWIIIPGSLRFLYNWLITVIPGSEQEDPLPRKLRAGISITFFVCLLIPFAIRHPFFEFTLSISGLLIIFSFASGLFLRIYKS